MPATLRLGLGAHSEGPPESSSFLRWGRLSGRPALTDCFVPPRRAFGKGEQFPRDIECGCLAGFPRPGALASELGRGLRVRQARRVSWFPSKSLLSTCCRV